MKKLKRKEVEAIFKKCLKGELHGIFYLNGYDCWGRRMYEHSESLQTIEYNNHLSYKFDKWYFIFDEQGYIINDNDEYRVQKLMIESFEEDTVYKDYAPFIFKDVVDAVLKHGLKGDFILRSGQKYSSELLVYEKSLRPYSFPNCSVGVDEYGLVNKYDDVKNIYDVIGFVPRKTEYEKHFLPITFPEAQKMFYRGGEDRELALRVFTQSELTQR